VCNSTILLWHQHAMLAHIEKAVQALAAGEYEDKASVCRAFSDDDSDLQ